jgi:hypothetical protein
VPLSADSLRVPRSIVQNVPRRQIQNSGIPAARNDVNGAAPKANRTFMPIPQGPGGLPSVFNMPAGYFEGLLRSPVSNVFSTWVEPSLISQGSVNEPHLFVP